MVSRWQCLMAVVSLVSACAPSSRVAVFQQLAPRSAPDSVEVYTEQRPARGYREVGTIELTASELSDDGYGDLVARARRQAAKMGGDAILVRREPRQRVTGMAVVPAARRRGVTVASATARVVETPRIVVVVVAWQAAPVDTTLSGRE